MMKKIRLLLIINGLLIYAGYSQPYKGGIEVSHLPKVGLSHYQEEYLLDANTLDDFLYKIETTAKN